MKAQNAVPSLIWPILSDGTTLSIYFIGPSHTDIVSLSSQTNTGPTYDWGPKILKEKKKVNVAKNEMRRWEWVEALKFMQSGPSSWTLRLFIQQYGHGSLQFFIYLESFKNQKIIFFPLRPKSSFFGHLI